MSERRELPFDAEEGRCRRDRTRNCVSVLACPGPSWGFVPGHGFGAGRSCRSLRGGSRGSMFIWQEGVELD